MCIPGWACRLAPNSAHQGPSSWEGDSWALPWGQDPTRSLPGWRQSVQREERALEGPGPGHGDSWGGCPGSQSRLVLCVLANDWTRPFPHLQKADDKVGVLSIK